MFTSVDIDALKAKKLCHHCVGEAYLKAEVQSQGKRLKCSYCGETANSYLIGDLADRTEFVFEQHFERTSDQPSSWQMTLLSDRESNYDWERDGEPVVYAIMNAADMPEAAAQDIQSVLDDRFGDFDSAAIGEETPFSSETYYQERGTSDEAWQREWSNFERSLKTEARFFSQSAADHLASIFDGIDTMHTRSRQPLVCDAGPSTQLTAFYRARVFQSDAKLEEALMRPDLHLGSPPPAHASAGRMNARGISVFYGANDPEVALAEVRPPVGSQVALARFEILRPLRLLDLTAVSAVSTAGSIFDEGYAARLERAMFLRSLSARITRPVMPDDEAFEYLATQAVADFLATEPKLRIDGIIFPSVQAAGAALNVVLFHKAARVAPMEIPEGTEVSARLGQMYEEGWEVEYSVVEETPPKKEDRAKSDTSTFLHLPDMLEPRAFDHPDVDHRETTLRVVTDTVKVHIIRAVKFTSEEHNVQRHRWEKHEPDF